MKFTSLSLFLSLSLSLSLSIPLSIPLSVPFSFSVLSLSFYVRARALSLCSLSSGATITIEDSVVTNNQVSDHGGGIFTDSASLTIHRTALSRNEGQNRAGGCLAAYNSMIEITTSNFSASRSSWRGAGFVFQNTTGTVTDANVFGNSVWHHHGAGVSIEYYSRVNLTGVNVYDNVNDGGNNWRYVRQQQANWQLRHDSGGNDGGGGGWWCWW